MKLEITTAVSEALRSRVEEALKKGFSVDIVAEIMGLPVAEVRRIADEMD